MMVTSDMAHKDRLSTILVSVLLATIFVTLGTVLFLSKALPGKETEALHYPANGFGFAFGSGKPAGEIMRVQQFSDGYALLTKGPVSIQAEEYRVLAFAWQPFQLPEEAAFFWRRADDPENVSRTEITASGAQLIDLSTIPQWSGEIIEFGFLLAGEYGKPVEVGAVSLIPDSLGMRLRLSWKAWTSFEAWSQQSINFLNGGDYRPVVAFPLVVATWLALSLLFIWAFQFFRSELYPGKLPMMATLFFVLAWMLLDIRWAVNNLEQIRLSLATQWQSSEHQRLESGLDGEVYQYVQRLKASVLGAQKARILIIGDKDGAYYQLRAKYHLLPHSAHVVSRFPNNLKPENIDFVMFFGDPASIAKVQGWNPSWQHSLTLADRGAWGAVYRVR